MSIRINASGEIVGITSLPSASHPLTIMMWFHRVFDRGSAGVIFTMFNHLTTPTTWLSMNLRADGDSIGYVDNNENGDFGVDVTTGAWSHLTFTWDGSVAELYVGASSVGTYTPSSAPSFTPAILVFGSDGGTYIDARLSAIKIWNAELSPAEISAEVNRYNPVRLANAWAVYPTHEADMYTDYSGNGRTLSLYGTTPTFEEQPPGVSWNPDSVYGDIHVLSGRHRARMASLLAR